MTKYILSSKKISEPVVFEYNSSGMLTAFKSEGLTEDQLKWVYDNFPIDIKGVEVLISRGLNFSKVDKVIDFDTFYKYYAKFYGSSIGRKEATPIWNRLSKANQYKAFEFVPQYFARCRNNHSGIKQTQRYLKHEPWND